MDFFGMGSMEILLILIVSLIIFGPGKLPEIGRKVGRMMHVLRKASFDLTAQVTKELEGKENDQARKSDAQTGESVKPRNK